MEMGDSGLGTHRTLLQTYFSYALLLTSTILALAALYRIGILVYDYMYPCRMMCEDEAWMERYRELTQGEPVFAEFAKLLPSKVEFEIGGRYEPKEYELKKHPHPLIHCVLRREAIEEFMAQRAFMKDAGVNAEVSVAFHGTKQERIQSIIDHGLLIPGQLIPGTMNKVELSAGPGDFGCGCYLGPHRSYVESHRGGSGGTFVCLVLRGRIKEVQFSPPDRKLEPGYDSHIDPLNGSEWVIFNSRQILPIYMIHSSQESSTTFTLPSWAKSLESSDSQSTRFDQSTHPLLSTMSEWSIHDLRQALRERDMNSRGSKNQLMQRMAEHYGCAFSSGAKS